MDLTKGVPQLVYIFLIDIYLFIEVVNLLNYADDTTVSHTDKDLKSICDILT